MKKIGILLLFVAIQTQQASAQEKTKAEKSDSIEAVLPQLSDTVKLRAIKELIDLNVNRPPAGRYLKLYREEARRQNRTRVEAFALLRLAQHHAQLETDSVFIYGEEAIRFTRQHRVHDYLFSAIATLIRRNVRDGHILTAIRRTEDALAEAKDLDEFDSSVEMLGSLAMIYYTIGQYEEAKRYWLESAEWAAKDRAHQITDLVNFYYCLSCMGIFLGRPHEALQYADSMFVEIERVPDFFPKRNMQNDVYYCEYQRAVAYAQMKQPEQSLLAIRRAEAIYDPQWKEVNGFFEVIPDDMYGAYYLAVRNYNKSLEHYSRVLAYFEGSSSGHADAIHFTRKYMAQAYDEKGDYRESAALYRQMMDTKDELNHEQFYKQINELRTLYALDKAEIEAVKHLAEIRRQRLVNAGLSTGCLALMLIIAITVWSRKKIAGKNRGLYRQIKEQERLADELEAMTQQYEQIRQFVPPSNGSETSHSRSAPGNDKQRHLVSQFREFLLKDKYFATFEIDIHEVAYIIATNKTTLTEALKCITGKSPMEYINFIRLDEAKRMLYNSDLTIEAIATDCGFNTRQTFYRQFKEQYRITPAEYRKIAKTQA
jgi:AraC-like DNA-binding protein